MNWAGIVLGLAVFGCIGLFHPIVIKAEYWFGTGALVGSLFVENVYGSTLLGVLAFSCYWSILELFEQKKRMEKGWFPKRR